MPITIKHGSIFDSTAERRARFERAYMAALGGYCANPDPKYDVVPAEECRMASLIALETVRQWDAMMAELEEI